MIQVEGVLLSEELFTTHFVCDLAACKGACCIDGDTGAPVEFQKEIKSILLRLFKSYNPSKL